jgi:class 3 adenylate cyclase
MTEARIIEAKYVFLDIVGFTRDRHVEAQAACVEKLNKIVRIALDSVVDVAPEDRILLPTGDGMCIVLLGRDAPYDIHVQVALAILANLDANNDQTEDEMLRFKVRIGINANEDNLITDINGNPNMAGSGINVAQRVMDSADGNQILVSTRVHETLRDRKKYMGMFRGYSATTKHGLSVPVYQLVKEGERGLNVDVPRNFQKPAPVEKEEPRLTKHVAYYLAHAIRNRPILVENKDKIYDDDDSRRQSESTEVEYTYTRTYKAKSATFWEQYEHYRSQDSYVMSDFGHFIQFGNEEYLSRYSYCFVKDNIGLSDYRAASERGREKLKRDWPEIWEEFGLEDGEVSQP